jgi:hypothetical protein
MANRTCKATSRNECANRSLTVAAHQTPNEPGPEGAPLGSGGASSHE